MTPNRKTTAIVLAGGRGTRIAELFPNLPKPLIPAHGRPFLYWVTSWLVGQGIADIVYSTGHLAGRIADWSAALPLGPGIRLRCRAEMQALGTGGGALNCLDMCLETVLILNGDSLVLADLGAAFDRLEADGLDGIIVGVDVPDTSRYGSLDVDAAGLLTGFFEKRPGQGLINGGIYLFRRAVLERFPQGVPLSIEYDILPGLLAQGARIGVAVIAGAPFLDIGTPETVDHATAFVQSRPEYFPPFDGVNAGKSCS